MLKIGEAEVENSPKQRASTSAAANRENNVEKATGRRNTFLPMINIASIEEEPMVEDLVPPDEIVVQSASAATNQEKVSSEINEKKKGKNKTSNTEKKKMTKKMKRKKKAN